MKKNSQWKEFGNDTSSLDYDYTKCLTMYEVQDIQNNVIGTIEQLPILGVIQKVKI